MAPMIKSRGPTMKGALVELFLLLAVGSIVIGVCCGWFFQSGESRLESRESRLHADDDTEGDGKGEFAGTVTGRRGDSEVAKTNNRR